MEVQAMNINELRNRVLSLPTLEKRLSSLLEEIRLASRQETALLEQYQKEKRDVEKLQNSTISKFFLDLVQRYDEKMDRDREEEIAAKMAYEKNKIHLSRLQADRDELETRIREIRSDDRALQAELEQRKNKLRLASGETAIRFGNLEAEKLAAVSQITEINEALTVADRAIATAESVLKSLDSAETWATIDMFSNKGGFISHMAKYSHVDEAEQQIGQLVHYLAELNRELKDVGDLEIPGLTGISSTQRSVDLWFDNIFTDISVRNKIKNNASEVRSLLNRLKSVQNSLSDKRQDVSRISASLDTSIEELLFTL
jgi:chromosome segregation ATPase